MVGGLLTLTDKEEALSRAYVAAVAAGAGCTWATQDFDRSGIDMMIQAGCPGFPQLDFQLKATVNLRGIGTGELKYALPRRNYDLLREYVLTPRFLVVLSLPCSEADWMEVTTKELVIRRCAYWISLSEFPETENKTSVTVTLKEECVFDVNALKSLMEERRKELKWK